MFDVPWSNDREVASIERRNLALTKPLSYRYHGGIGTAERKIGILLDQRGHPADVVPGRRLDLISVGAK